MTEQPQAPEPDGPAPVEPDGPAPVEPDAAPSQPTVLHGTVPVEPDAAPAQPTVVHGTVPASPPPDATPVGRPAEPAETYHKPSAPSPTQWSRPAEAELDGAASADGAAVAPSASPLQERPELALGAAFAGGLVVALILKRLAR